MVNEAATGRESQQLTLGLHVRQVAKMELLGNAKSPITLYPVNVGTSYIIRICFMLITTL
jgi:hypothetical protein